MVERLACMLLAYMMLESATYTQKALRTYRIGRKLAWVAAAAAPCGRVMAAASEGARRSRGEAFIACAVTGSWCRARGAPWNASLRSSVGAVRGTRGFPGRARQ